jgi:hypothetical protein
LTRFHEFGDQSVEINDELWAEVLPVLMNVDVAIRKDEQQAEPAGIATPAPIADIGI